MRLSLDFEVGSAWISRSANSPTRKVVPSVEIKTSRAFARVWMRSPVRSNCPSYAGSHALAPARCTKAFVTVDGRAIRKEVAERFGVDVCPKTIAADANNVAKPAVKKRERFIPFGTTYTEGQLGRQHLSRTAPVN